MSLLKPSFLTTSWWWPSTPTLSWHRYGCPDHTHGVLGLRPGPKEYNPRHLGSHSTAIWGGPLTSPPSLHFPAPVFTPGPFSLPGNTHSTEQKPPIPFLPPYLKAWDIHAITLGVGQLPPSVGLRWLKEPPLWAQNNTSLQQNPTWEPPRPSTRRKAQPSGGSGGSKSLQHKRCTHWPGRRCVRAARGTPSVCMSLIPHKLQTNVQKMA